MSPTRLLGPQLTMNQHLSTIPSPSPVNTRSSCIPKSSTKKPVLKEKEHDFLITFAYACHINLGKSYPPDLEMPSTLNQDCHVPYRWSAIRKPRLVPSPTRSATTSPVGRTMPAPMPCKEAPKPPGFWESFTTHVKKDHKTYTFH